MSFIIGLSALIASICFILALKGLSHPETARRGLTFGAIGMVIAISSTFFLPSVQTYTLPIVLLIAGGAVGAVIATRVGMTALPQLMAAFHSLVGLAAVFIASAAFTNPMAYGIGTPETLETNSLVEMGLGAAIGAITFTGSIIAFAKLQGLLSGKPIKLPHHHLMNLALGLLMLLLVVMFSLTGNGILLFLLIAIALLVGVTLIIPIGGADMPVVVSMLNSYSGWAAAGIGFTLQQPLLIITGALVGASGAILSYIMCKGMNRSFISVILGGFGGGGDTTAQAANTNPDGKAVKLGAAEDAAYLMKNAGSVIIVPGYGMAVAQAQHAVREMADVLKAAGVSVKYAIHPVAGRMPGHMNVLLAEANVPYDDVFELDDINREFATADVAYVIGANDITNPSAKSDPASPIYGMPVLDVGAAKTVFFVKRSMGSGYAGVDNPLFFNDNTLMLLGDAKTVTEHIVKAMKE